MTPKQKKRLTLVAILVIGVGIATAFALIAFQRNLLYFVTPSQIAKGELPDARALRIGGMVVDGSVEREGVNVSFELTDTAESVVVTYSGILPDLFREGQGIVAEGVVSDDGVFEANKVLAKHDENYMPPEATEALKQSVKHADWAKSGSGQ